RNANGKVLLYAKKITQSMQKAFEITSYRRAKQEEFNKIHNITPKTVTRALEEELKLRDNEIRIAKALKKDKMPKSEREKIIKELDKKMRECAKNLDFEEAMRLRDEIAQLRTL
ncbi:UvrB/UvrC motif-containing protein, partial [Helicobacter pylori]